MSKRKLAISVVILVVIVTAYFVYYIISQTPNQQTHNLVSNPGFEEGFKDWTSSYCSLSTTEKSSGKYSVLIEDTISQILILNFSGTYRMGLSYKPLSIDEPVFMFGYSYFLFLRNLNGTWRLWETSWFEYGDSARIISDVDIGNGWRKLTVEFNISAYTLGRIGNKGSITAYLPNAVNGYGPQYVDDFFLELVSVSTS